jgi:hypothetical protein
VRSFGQRADAVANQHHADDQQQYAHNSGVVLDEPTDDFGPLLGHMF